MNQDGSDREPSTCGASWEEDGTAAIYATGHTGQGRITGIRPQTAMDLAVMLARNARAQGVAWPTQFWDDPWEAGAVNGLRTALQERGPYEIDLDPKYDRDQLGDDLDIAERRLCEAAAAVQAIRNLLYL